MKLPADAAKICAAPLPHLLLVSCLLLSWAGQGHTAAHGWHLNAHLPGNPSSLHPLVHQLSAVSGCSHWGLCLLQGRASSDHTTLLLNCYTKLKNLSKLDSFLKGDGSDDGTPLLNFDVDTAVKVGPGLNKVWM